MRLVPMKKLEEAFEVILSAALFAAGRGVYRPHNYVNMLQGWKENIDLAIQAIVAADDASRWLEGLRHESDSQG